MSLNIKRAAASELTQPPAKRQKHSINDGLNGLVSKVMLIFDPPTCREEKKYQAYMDLRAKKETRKIAAIWDSDKTIEQKQKQVISIAMYSFSPFVSTLYNMCNITSLSNNEHRSTYSFHQSMVQNDIFVSWSLANHTYYFSDHHRNLTDYYAQQSLLAETGGKIKKTLSFAFKAYLGNPAENRERLISLRERYYQHFRSSPFEKVPDEVIVHILSFVPQYDRLSLMPVCGRFKILALDQYLWRSFLPKLPTKEISWQKINYKFRILNKKPIKQFVLKLDEELDSQCTTLVLKNYVIYNKNDKTNALCYYNLNEPEKKYRLDSAFESAHCSPKIHSIGNNKFLIYSSLASGGDNPKSVCEIVTIDPTKQSSATITKYDFEDVDDLSYYTHLGVIYLFGYKTHNLGLYILNLCDRTMKYVTWNVASKPDANLFTNGCYLTGIKKEKDGLFLWDLGKEQEIPLPQEISDYAIFNITSKSLILTGEMKDNKNNFSIVIFDLSSKKVIPVKEIPNFKIKINFDPHGEPDVEDYLSIQEWDNQILIDDSTSLTLYRLSDDQTKYEQQWEYKHEHTFVGNNIITPKQEFIILGLLYDFLVLDWTTGELLVRYESGGFAQNFNGNDLVQWGREYQQDSSNTPVINPQSYLQIQRFIPH